jgi:hypothetical protein
MAIEQRITAALTSQDIKSDALAELIVETEAAIAAAEKAAEAERSRALDPLQSPDADAAHAAMLSAEFAVQRLHTMLPRLQQRHRQVAGAEEYAAWAATFDALKPKHAGAASKLKAIYTEFVPKLVVSCC